MGEATRREACRPLSGVRSPPGRGRDERERDLDTKRHRMQLIAERRRAFGAARVLERELTHRALLVERLFEDIDTDADMITIQQDGEDATLLAAWLSDATWGYVCEALAFLQHLRWDVPTGETIRLLANTGSPYGEAHSAISDALQALQGEIEERLSSDAQLSAPPW